MILPCVLGEGAVVFHSSCFGNPVQQPSEKASQLIEVIRARQVYVFPDRDFITLSDLVHAEDNNRHILSYRSTLSNTAGVREISYNEMPRYFQRISRVAGLVTTLARREERLMIMKLK